METPNVKYPGISGMVSPIAVLILVFFHTPSI
jgi:hypothetical protein